MIKALLNASRAVSASTMSRQIEPDRVMKVITHLVFILTLFDSVSRRFDRLFGAHPLARPIGQELVD
jgi:hypothetical protein